MAMVCVWTLKRWTKVDLLGSKVGCRSAVYSVVAWGQGGNLYSRPLENCNFLRSASPTFLTHDADAVLHSSSEPAALAQ